MHAEIGPNAALRTGMVFPLTSDNNRFFDAETMVTLILYP